MGEEEKKKVWLALCLVIPAGIAFAEEEVIIIEEPVAAEEVVEEVVEVEPVEDVTPVSSLDDDSRWGKAIGWKDIADLTAAGGIVTIVPTHDTDGWYEINGKGAPIKAIDKYQDTVTLRDKTDLVKPASCGGSNLYEGTDANAVHYCSLSFTYRNKKNELVTVTHNELINKNGTEKLSTSYEITLAQLDAEESVEDKKVNDGSEDRDISAAIDETAKKYHNIQKVSYKANCLHGEGYVYKCVNEDCGLAANVVTPTMIETALKASGDQKAFGEKYEDAAKLMDDNGYIEAKTGKDMTNHEGSKYWDKETGAWNYKKILKDYEEAKTSHETNIISFTYDRGDKDPVEPSCAADGLGYFKCEQCEEWFPITVPALPHTPTAAVVKIPATCLEGGLNEVKCAVCSQVIEQIPTEALGHKFEGATSENWTQIGEQWTVDEDGEGTKGAYHYAQWYIVCNRTIPDLPDYECGYVHIEVTKGATPGADAEAPSDYNECKGSHTPVTIPAVPATATKNGMTECVYCSACGTLITPAKMVPALGAGLEKNKETDAWEYWVDGKKDASFTGLIPYDGETFFVNKGVVDTSANGLEHPDVTDDTWYFFAAGMVVRNHAGFVMYDGSWFYITDEGKLDTTTDGLYEYDGAKFLVKEGRMRTDVSGVFTSEGKLVLVTNGMFREDYTGEYTDSTSGLTYDVVKGVATEKTAA